VILRCAAFWKCLHGIGWKLEAWLTGSEFVLSLKPLASSKYPFWLAARYLFFGSLPN
jgi:hypothetical protein